MALITDTNLSDPKRDRAWEVYPYPCIGLFRFLDLDLYARKDVYPRLLSRLKGEEDCKFLDVGCCLGQDIRKLRFDGVPGERLFGAEINNGFIDLGYQLFRDRDTLGAKIMVADISDDQGLLSGYAGKFDVERYRLEKTQLLLRDGVWQRYQGFNQMKLEIARGLFLVGALGVAACHGRRPDKRSSAGGISRNPAVPLQPSPRHPHPSPAQRYA